MAAVATNGASNGISNGLGKLNGTNGVNGHKFDVNSVLKVNRSDKAFASWATSLVDLPAGAVFSPIEGITSGVKAYTSVQTGPNSHIELNSDLVFCNHSCDPTLEFDMSQNVVRVSRDRDLKKGDLCTFFYPSSEWDMDQPFDCHCNTSKCKGLINGAGKMDESVVRQYWLNPHIEALLKERSAKGQNGHTNGHANGLQNGA